MTTELLLIRHGKVAGAQGGKRVSGLENPPLSLEGREAAEKLAKHLAEEGGIAALFTSPLIRARETADILAASLHLESQVVDELSEWNFQREMRLGHRLQLLAVTILSHLAPFRPLLIRQWRDNPVLRAFVETVTIAIQQIIADHPNEHVAIVAHGGTIDALLTHYFPNTDQWERGVIRNCSVTRLAVGQTETKLLAFNDCRYLQ